MRAFHLSFVALFLALPSCAILSGDPDPSLSETAAEAAAKPAPNPMLASVLQGDGRQREPRGFRAPDGTRFGWKRWGSDHPHAILICVHGLSGAVEDYDYLASQLNLNRYTLYSYDLRAMGRDPRPEYRGDIHDRNLWSRELLAFDGAVRTRHPGVPVIWYGESLGALIILQTNARHEVPPLAGVALASPIVKVRGKLPGLHLFGFTLGCWLLPDYRIEIERLAGNPDLTGTGADLADQLAATPWAVPSYTLRTLCSLRTMAERAPARARRLDTPLLVLHGGRDMFENPTNVGDFLAATPQVDITYHYYASGHHLLLYDKSYRHQVATDIATWLENF